MGPSTMAANGTILALVALLVSPISVAAAQDSLAAARAAYDEGAFDRALELYERALDEGGHPPERLARIHHRLGTIRAAVGEDVAARRHFEVALAIDPTLEAPAELGPERRALFDEVRSGRRRAARVLASPLDPPRPEDTRLSVELDGMPSGAASRVRVRVRPPDGPPWIEERPATGGTVTIPVPAAAWRASDRVRADVEVLDRHGSVLATATVSLVADAQVTETAGLASSVEGTGDVTAEPWFWAVVIGAAVAIVAVAIAVPVAVAAQPRDRYVLVGF